MGTCLMAYGKSGRIWLNESVKLKNETAKALVIVTLWYEVIYL